MSKNSQNSKPDKTKKIFNLFRLSPYLQPYRLEIFFVIITLILTSFTVLFLGKVVKYLIDLGFSSKDFHYLNIILTGLVFLIILLAVAGYFRSFLVNSVAEKVVNDIRKDIYSHIIRVSPEFFETTKTGDITSRLTVDTSVLYNIISNSISFALRNFLLFIGGSAFLFFTSPALTLVSIALIPISVAPILIMGKGIKNLSNQSQEAISNIGSHIEETINGIRTIQSYVCEEKEVINFNNHASQALLVSLKKIRLRSLLISMVIAFAFGSIAVVLWCGGHMVLEGKMTSGDLSSFIFYSILSATSLVAISQVMGQLQTASGAAERLFELLQIKSPVIESPKPEKFLLGEQNSIIFNHVNFSYPSRKDFLSLQNFNLEIKPQEKIAIIGESGSGKTTILQLLLRFYNVNSGDIFINQQNIKNLALKDLRAAFSYISQDCFIFSGTIYENIAYVNQNITFSEVEKIIEENEALHFIKKLPAGIHHFVGEKGSKLSGGEKQRIAIARAIIKNSSILLMDEATSALDNENESLITEALNKISQNKTVIVVSHKFSEIANCDRIVLIEDGKISAIGNQQDLFNQGEFYQKMNRYI